MDTEPLGHANTSVPRVNRRVRNAIIGILLVQAVFGAVILWAVTSPTWQVRWVRVQAGSL